MGSGARDVIDDFYDKQKGHQVLSKQNEYAHLSPQDWNLKVGKDVNPEDDDETQFKHLNNEFGRLVEESQEGFDGSELGNRLGVLDAYCDIKFVFKNLENRLRKYGYDVDGAFDAVCINNSLKYTTDIDLARQWHRHWDWEGDYLISYAMCTTIVDGIPHYCVKRVADDKVMKPPQFVGVELESYLPKNI